jgi:hypothetical protein
MNLPLPGDILWIWDFDGERQLFLRSLAARLRWRIRISTAFHRDRPHVPKPRRNQKQ